jgi:hypothetical protein
MSAHRLDAGLAAERDVGVEPDLQVLHDIAYS